MKKPERNIFFMIKGFILAAGFSKRLRPITEYIPKPLIPIVGEVLLEYIYKFLKASGIDKIGINLHYKADEIEKYIMENKLSLEIFHEKEILNTGGALYNARDFLKDSIFIVHNADIYWDGNINEALNWHLNSGNHITVLVHNYPPHNKLIIDEKSNLRGITNQSSKAVAFTGIAIYSPEILELLPKGESSIIDLWNKAIDNGFKVRVFHAKYSFWSDIGTPSGYASAVFEKLKRNFSSIYVHQTASGCELINPLGNIVIERDVKIKKPFTARNIIVLPETELLPNTEEISDSIICKDFVISISQLQTEQENLTLGGSARRYFRKDDKVFCQWDEITQDFEKTIKLGRFLKEKGLPLPEIIDFDIGKRLIIFEDLGDITLYSWLQCKRNDEEVFQIYKKIVENIIKLHWEISSDAPDIGIILPEFDYEYFRWESEYFLRECVEGVFKINLSDSYKLQTELDKIAQMLSKAKKVILHRDLQSQNIMLKNGEIYFIDYQSARWGPPGYDLASLLWDPYVELNDEIRHKLLNLYIKKAPLNIEPSAFFEELSFLKIQRHMQAVGAYGFLSLKKGKKSFLKFIPRALNLLYQDLQDCHINFPELKKLIIKLLDDMAGINL